MCMCASVCMHLIACACGLVTADVRAVSTHLLLTIIQVTGKPHEHHTIIKELHQNLRDTFVSDTKWRGQVALVCADDLEKMQLNHMAYNKKRPVLEGHERTAHIHLRL